MITAIIPVRKGSQRVKNKNIKPFAGSSLLEIKIKLLLKLQNYGKIDELIVSSDCDQMISIAEKNGAKTHRRKEYFASSDASNSEFFQNLADDVGKNNWILYSPVTCPLISFETYDEILSRFKQDPKNLVSVFPVKHHLWLDGSPVNYDPKESPNSQDLPNIYGIQYGVSMIKRNDMKKYRNVVTQNPTFIVLDEIESIDIDTELEFEFAEFIYSKIYNKD